MFPGKSAPGSSYRRPRSNGTTRSNRHVVYSRCPLSSKAGWRLPRWWWRSRWWRWPIGHRWLESYAYSCHGKSLRLLAKVAFFFSLAPNRLLSCDLFQLFPASLSPPIYPTGTLRNALLPRVHWLEINKDLSDLKYTRCKRRPSLIRFTSPFVTSELIMKQLNNWWERCYDNAFGEWKKKTLFLSTSALRARMLARRLRLHCKINVYDKIDNTHYCCSMCLGINSISGAPLIGCNAVKISMMDLPQTSESRFSESWNISVRRRSSS